MSMAHSPVFLSDCNRKHDYSYKSYDLLANFVVNYVVTIKGTYNDLDSVKTMAAEKRFKSYEKVFHPVYLKIILRKHKKNGEIVLRRTNTNKDQIIPISNIIKDARNSNYFYLEAIDTCDISRSRIHIFNTINEQSMRIIKENNPHFGTLEDMINSHYSIPRDMVDVVRCIQTFCIPRLGNNVSTLKEIMASPLKNVFMKRTKTSSSVKVKSSSKGGSKFKSYVKEATRSSSPELMKKMQHKPSLGSLDFKSHSIEKLLLMNSELDSMTIFGHKDAYRYRSNEELDQSSTQSSLNDYRDFSDFSAEVNVYFYKFENALEDKSGLKHFKNFLTEEFSSENVLFWEAVNNFSKITDEKLRKTEARKIFITYIEDTEEKEKTQKVNLEGYVVEKIRNKLSTSSNDMFNVAQRHIYQLMKNDSYSRFIISPHFNLWRRDKDNNSGMKPATSSSSLTGNKKQRSLLPNFLKSKSKLSKEDSRKSSIQTIESDCSSTGSLINSCKIILAYDTVQVHVINIVPNKRLNSTLKKLDKKFVENEFMAFDEYNQKVVHFTEQMTNLVGRKIVIEKCVIIRVGFVQNTMDTMLYENLWFVLKCRSSICLSSAIDPIVKRLQMTMDKCCVVKEENSKVKLEWDTPVNTLHNSLLLIIELNLFSTAKLFSKSLVDNFDSLWKKIIKDNVFQCSLPFDQDNILDSQCELFVKYKLEPRRVGYILTNEISDGFMNRGIQNSFDDQRGMFTEDQLTMPDFLKVPRRCHSEDSSSTNSKSLSALNLGDSDFSFSEIDENSDPSPDKYELTSDFE